MVNKTDREIAIERHGEISMTVRRTMFAQLTYSAFAFLTISQSDIGFILPQEGAKLPLLDVNLGFEPFLIIAPIGFWLIVVYQYLFLAKLGEIEAEYNLKYKEKQPFLFNLDGILANSLRIIIFDILPPIVFVAFIWKAGVRDDIFIFVGPIGILLLWCSLFLTSKKFLGQINIFPLKKVNATTVTFRLFLPIFLTIIVSLTPFYFANQKPGQYIGYRSLDLRSAQLSNIDIINKIFYGANLTDANFKGTDLSGANFENAILRRADLRDSDLTNANFKSADLSRSNLSGVIFSRAMIENVDFSYANLSNSNFRNAFLNGANLEGADLTKADMSNSTLTDTNFLGAYLKGAIFKGADLGSANNLKQYQLDEACGDQFTNLPTGLTIDLCIDEETN